jgi:hypothetical protein
MRQGTTLILFLIFKNTQVNFNKICLEKNLVQTYSLTKLNIYKLKNK